MANTLPANEVFAKQLMYEANEALFFNKFIGAPGTRSLIIRYDDLTKSAGDVIKIPIVKRLTGTGVTGNNTLEGNEEDITTSTFPLTIDYIRHAVKFTKKDQQQTAYDLLTTGKNLLSNWAKSKIEKMLFDNMSTGNDIVLYGGDATTVDEIDSADTMTTALISKAKAKIKASRECYPVNVNGKDYYVMFVDPYQAYALKLDSAWQQAQREANVRGLENPIFSGALGIWDGVIIYESEYVQSGTNANTTPTRYAKALLLGAEAVAYGYGQEFSFNVQKSDYDFVTGVGTDACMNIAPVIFDSKQHGIIAVITAAVDPNA